MQIKKLTAYEFDTFAKNHPLSSYHQSSQYAEVMKEKAKKEKTKATREKEERQLIYLRYFANRTQVEVGQALGISQVQVSRMEKRILSRLRQRI